MQGILKPPDVSGVQKKINMLKLIFIPILFITSLSALANDPGSLLKKDSLCTVWWSNNTTKIMQNSPVPLHKGRIKVLSARNESEGFQLVLTPSVDINDISVSISDFSKKDGNIIPSANINIRNVEYVHITKPSGKHHTAGWYPDPLPLYKKPLRVKAGVNKTLWFTIKVPKNAAPGSYTATITLKSEIWESSFPVELKVWNFALPEVPYMRSAFNLYSKLIRQYHNLETNDELKEVLEQYYLSFKEYRISPQQFFDQYPIQKTVKGVKWQGGTFDPDTVFAGKYSYQVNDTNVQANICGTGAELIKIDPKQPYMLKWWAKTPKNDQQYAVTVQSYDSDRKQIHWQLQGMIYSGNTEWKKDSLFLDPVNPFVIEQLVVSRPIPDEAEYVSIHLYPLLPLKSGEPTGTVWFDNLSFVNINTKENLVPYGDFEQNLNDLDLEIDFSEFDFAARKYLDEFGFTGFRFKIPELRPGPFFGRKTGWFHGFVNGTEEYKKLMKLFLGGFQDHLEANGWLGKEYLYWIDEPKHEDYAFVREGMNTIKEAAPKLTRFITENNPGPEIMDVTDIGCPVLAKFDPEKSKEWIEQGRQMWSYLMTWPKAPHLNLFIDSDAINMRMWLWMSYRYKLTGILVWSSNVWNAEGCSPPGLLQNIWEDPMTYKDSYGAAVGGGMEYGNGDGMFFYPPNRDPNNDKTKYIRGPVPSIRLEIMREGIDDYDYMILLEKSIENARPDQKGLVAQAKAVLGFGNDVFTNDKKYAKSPKTLLAYRRQMGALLEKFNKK
ncbi:MAG: DUF4091 domain-containing protein [Oleispira sp.]|nr:DUF4091 domain-containing protein [Oleispira sp.]